MSAQNNTGEWTEQRVQTHLEALGLEARKPAYDVGVDLEVWHRDRPEKRLRVQVKGRGKKQENEQYRWFQIRTTPKQRADTVKAGLPASEAWQKKVELCQFFVLVSEKYDECWVFPAAVIADVIRLNRPKYGKWADNVAGEKTELNLDIEHEGKALTEIFGVYRNNFALICAALGVDVTPEVLSPSRRRAAPLDLRTDVFAPVLARMRAQEGSLRAMKRFKRTGIEGWFKVEVVAALGNLVRALLNVGPDLLIDDGSDLGTKIELKAATNFDRVWFVQGIGKYGVPCLFLGDGTGKQKFPCTDDDHFDVVGCEVFADGAGGDWFVGLVRPRV